MKSFQEFRSEISIIELALANGYKLDKKAGLKYPVLKDEISGDKVIIINPNSSSNQGYFNPHNDQQDKGTLIHFVENRLGSIFTVTDSTKSKAYNINAVLYGYLNQPLPERKIIQSNVKAIADQYTAQTFNIPADLRPAFNVQYLNARNIPSAIINSPTFKGTIMNITKNGFINIAFPYTNELEQTIGLELRNKQFKHFLHGSDRTHGIWHSNYLDKVENVVLTESPIDSLSYHQLKGKNNNLYIAFGGAVTSAQIETVKNILSNVKLSSSYKIISAVDNDEAGRKYTGQFHAAFPSRVGEDYPERNDYNEDLSASIKRNSYKR